MDVDTRQPRQFTRVEYRRLRVESYRVSWRVTWHGFFSLQVKQFLRVSQVMRQNSPDLLCVCVSRYS